MIEQVRVSERARVQLINIKRRTGVQNWNIICRWALAISLKDKKLVRLQGDQLKKYVK